MDVFSGSNDNQAPVITYSEECWHGNAGVLEWPVKEAIRLKDSIIRNSTLQTVHARGGKIP